jgi:hypothetical protein
MKLIAPLAMSALVLILSSAAEADTKSAGFMYEFSDGASYTKIGSSLGQLASVGMKDDAKSSCHFRSGNATSAVDLGASQGVQIDVVPLEETSDGVRTLVSISRTTVADEKTVAVATGADACTLTTGDFNGHTTRIVRSLPIGKPVAVKMQDGTTYTVTATKS